MRILSSLVSDMGYLQHNKELLEIPTGPHLWGTVHYQPSLAFTDHPTAVHFQELIPLLLCVACLHPEFSARDEHLNMLFNLIKRPDEEQR